MPSRDSVIDAHHHLWRYSAAEYEWIDDRMAALRRDFLPVDFVTELANAGINGAVTVQARQTLEETRWLLELAGSCNQILGVVGWAPIASANFEASLDTLATNTKLVGLRHVVQAEPQGFLDGVDFNRGIGTLHQTGLVYDLLVVEHQLEEAIRFVDRHPQQVFVLDHIAKPKIAAGEIEPWRTRIQQLSKRSNVCCKISGMVTEDSWSHWSMESLRPFMDTVVDAFGANRLMAGSDWPVCLVATNYAKWWQILRDYFADFSSNERENIFGTTATRIYNLKIGRTPMKAVVVQAPGKASLADIPEPSNKSGEALLQIRMIGLCGTDLNTFRGKNPLVTFPRVLGHEVAATILHAGNGLSNDLREGAAVTLAPYTACGQCASCLRGRLNACSSNQTLGVQRDGALTERIAIPAEKLYGAQLSLKELCLVEPLTVGFHAAKRGRVTKRDTVAVFGCGGVGLGAISASAFHGARVIAIDIDDGKLEIARKAGATEFIHSGKEDLHDRLRKLTDGRGPDCVIEAIGLPQTFRASVEEVAFTGRVVYIGYAKEPVAYETSLFVQKELDILGSRNALPEDFREVIRMLEEHRFPVDDVISAVVPIEEAPEILRQWSNNPTAFTKIIGASELAASRSRH